MLESRANADKNQLAEWTVDVIAADRQLPASAECRETFKSGLPFLLCNVRNFSDTCVSFS